MSGACYSIVLNCFSRMDQQKSGDILHLFNKGDRSAFTAIYNCYSNRVFLYAKYLLNSRVEAEDIVSDTFLKLWKERAQFRTHDKIIAFLIVTARNACIDWLRHRQIKGIKRKEVLEAFLRFHEPASHSDPIVEELKRQVATEIEKLPEQSRRILTLSYMEEIRNQEIAQRMRISEKTVRNNKSSALKLIRLRLLKKDLLIGFPLSILTSLI